MAKVIARSEALVELLGTWIGDEGERLVCDKWLREVFNVPPSARRIWLVAYDSKCPGTVEVHYDARLRDIYIDGFWMPTHSGTKSAIENMAGKVWTFYLSIEYET